MGSQSTTLRSRSAIIGRSVAATATRSRCGVGQAYPYRRLEGTDIRFITLHPFNKDVGIVECNIWQKPLEEAQYTALSYTWGQASVTETILLAGHRFEVTANLAACLKQLAVGQAAKDPAEGNACLDIWVDAICINQNDLAERNAQVLRMRDIFPHAQNLIVWLGQEGPHTGLAVERINYVAQFQEENEDVSDFLDRIKRIPEHIIGLATDEHEIAIRTGVMDIYKREWWDRTWILQEVGLSRYIVVHCGSYTMEWNALYSYYKVAAYLSIERPESFFNPGDEGMRMLEVERITSTTLILREGRQDSNQNSLHLLLEDARGSKATDPRDKVYGLLGLSSDFRSGEISPRYELPVQDVFLDVLKAHFQKHDSLDILDQCYFSHTGELGLPTWIPNWDSPSQLLTMEEHTAVIPKFLTNQGEELKQAFDACGGLSLSSRSWFFGEDSSLHLTGACFDTVESVTEVANYFDGWTLESLLEVWLRTVLTPDAPYPYAPGTWHDAFRKTIVMDISFACNERGFSMVFPDDLNSEEATMHFNHLMEARAALYAVCHMKRLAYTAKGMMGLVRAETQVGDRVAVLAGSKVLHCLREVTEARVPGSTRYQLVGEAYFHGMMDGEAMNGLELGEIVLV